MAIRNRSISFIMALVVIFSCISTCIAVSMSFSYASETDRVRTITVYTEPDDFDLDGTHISETGTGLDTLVTPSYASGYDITWKSSDSDIATVDENGHVHGRLVGKYAHSSVESCVITATVKLGELTSSDNVQVIVKRGYDIDNITLNMTSIKLDAGASYSLKVNYDTSSPANVRDEIYFLSSDPSVAFVDDEGTVTGMSNGTAVITAYTINGLSASCKVIIGPDNPSDTQTADDIVPVDELIILYNSSVSAKSIKSTLNEHGAVYEGMLHQGDGEKAVLTSLSDDTDIEGLLDEVRQSQDIIYVQPNFRYSLSSSDPAYSQVGQYYHFHAGFDKAWELMEKNGIEATTCVGILDSGVDADHLDLRANLILDAEGKYTRFENGAKVMDIEDVSSIGHGTHVAGIIGAVFDNGICGAGTATGKNNDYSRILPVGTINKETGYINTYDLICAMDLAVDRGAKVINMSLGGAVRDRLLGTAIQDHYYNDNVVFVGSAGNDATDYASDTFQMSYPADLTEMISVCNINNNSKKHSSSNYGYAKDISATGVSITSTLPGNKFGSMTGTSMSAPVVSAACALILDACPDLTPGEVRNILCATSSDPSGYFSTNGLGYGELDAYAAVEAAYKIKNKTVPDSIAISIKTPDRSKKAVEKAETTYNVTFPNLKMIKKLSGKKKAGLSFSRPEAYIRKTVKTVLIDPYTGDQTVKETAVTSKTVKSGIRYRFAYRLKGSGKWKYINLPASSKSSARYTIKHSNSRVSIKIKKLRSGKTYYYKVRPFRKVGGKYRYGKWTALRKTKVK